MNWEIGIDIYTLICIKWITNKNLLYTKISEILKLKKKLSGGPISRVNGYNVISHNSSYYFKMCISEIKKKESKWNSVSITFRNDLQ